jgi:hypothetical protein
MRSTDKYTDQTYTYLALRKAVGWIGIVLPFGLMTGMSLIFKGDIIQKTISQYYYTCMRDVLTGSLCAIALFMFYYTLSSFIVPSHNLILYSGVKQLL